jgi:hypothetical protein
MVQEQAAVLGGAGERRNRPKSEFPILIESDPANLTRSSGERRKKRKGDFSCESSPSLSDFSKIWFGFQITTDSRAEIIRVLQACACISVTLSTLHPL